MTIENFDVEPLFATPYFRANLNDAISREQIDLIKNFKMIPNQQNLISENLSIFEHPKLVSIKNAVQEALDLYATKVMGITQKLYVTQSWSLINRPNIGMHNHSHSNSIVSGSLYYAELPTPVSRMVFDKYTTYRQLVINPSKENQNIYNTPVNTVTPRTFDILLFPSDLTHQVEPNLSEKPRFSIAFNCFIKGKFGNLRDVSQLTL